MTSTIHKLTMVVLIYISLGSVDMMSDEKRLIKYLLQNYENIGIVGRPVQNTSETLTIKFGLTLTQIVGLDEKDEVLTTNVWSKIEWRDILLQWDPAQYGNVRDVRVPVSKIWTPDIVLYNFCDLRLKEHRETMAMITHEGKVFWMPRALFRSTCSIDTSLFPYDEQTCHLKFGSWTYDKSKLDLDFYEDNADIDLEHYDQSDEWELLDTRAKKSVDEIAVDKPPYVHLIFTIQLKRKATFYGYILIMPAVLLSVLTYVIFWLPNGSDERIGLGINLFVAFFVLLLILAESVPSASPSISFIVIYLCVILVFIVLSIIVSAFNTYLYHKAAKEEEKADKAEKAEQAKEARTRHNELLKVMDKGEPVNDESAQSKPKGTVIKGTRSLSVDSKEEKAEPPVTDDSSLSSKLAQYLTKHGRKLAKRLDIFFRFFYGIIILVSFVLLLVVHSL